MIDYVQTLQEQLAMMARSFVQHLPSIVIALAVLLVTFIIARFAVQIADRLTGRTPMRENLKQLIDTLVKLAIWIVGLLLAATIAMPGLTPASLFAGLGIGALAIGFAFQDIFENFLAGVLIMIRDRMAIGDSIECQSIAGTVERITLRETYIRGASNELNIVPNSVLFKNPVKVTTDSPHRRFEITVGVVSDYDLDEAAAAIRSAVEAVPDLDTTHPVDVFAREFQSGAVTILVRWWSAARPKDFVLQDRVVRGIKTALDEAGIEIAGAQATTIDIKRPPEPRGAPRADPPLARADADA